MRLSKRSTIVLRRVSLRRRRNSGSSIRRCNGRREALIVLRGDEEPVALRRDDLADTPRVGSDSRKAERHRLHVSNAKGLRIGLEGRMRRPTEAECHDFVLGDRS